MDKEQQKTLLKLARETITAYLNNQDLPPLPEIPGEQADFGGAFVTMRNNEQLRGCMGQFLPKSGLADTIQQIALLSMQDPRFRVNPVTTSELPQITIEISVLSPLERTNNPLSLQPGVHGVYIRRDSQAGCFLPQVATEQGWGNEEFLSHCCAGKAGLPADAWKDPQTEVYLFTAEVFSEEELKD
jgi:AmmeMemoRadiSam system protein A